MDVYGNIDGRDDAEGDDDIEGDVEGAYKKAILRP